MTGAEVLADMNSRGVRLTVIDGRLRVEAAVGTLNEPDRLALAANKNELLTLLTAVAWNKVEANRLIAEVQHARASLGQTGWPQGAADCSRLANLLFDGVDAAYLAQDMSWLQQAVAVTLEAIKGLVLPGVPDPDAGLSWSKISCPGCVFCSPTRIRKHDGKETEWLAADHGQSVRGQ